MKKRNKYIDSNKIKNNLYLYGLLALLVLIFYGNTLVNGFVYDDPGLISNNEIIKSYSNIPKILTGCATGFKSDDCHEAGVYYRPLIYLQFMVTYSISSKPWFFHLVNLFFLWISSVLVFRLFLVLFQKKIPAIFGAIIFLINPINSEVANFVAAINDQHLLIFFILSFLSYAKFRSSKRTKYLIISSICFFLALAAKESAILLFVTILIYEQFYLPKSSSKIFIRKWSIYFLIPIFIYFFIRLLVFGRIVHNLAGYHDLNSASSLLTAFSIYPIYLSKLIYPLPLNAQHDPPIIHTIDFRFFISLFIWIGSFFLVYLGYRKNAKHFLFGFSLVFLSLLPILIFINKVGRFVLTERWLFLASVGFSIISIWFSVEIINYFKKRKIRYIQKILLVVFFIYAISSWVIIFNRNKDWYDEFSFNKSIAKYAKTNEGVHYNLGVNYLNNQEYELASESFKNALNINPKFWHARYNLGRSYIGMKDLNQANKEFQAVLDIDPKLKIAENSINNIKLVEQSFAKYKIKSGLIIFSGNWISFNYPLSWSLKEENEKITLKDEDDLFSVEFAQDFKGKEVSYNNYISSNLDNFGNLQNQGLAEIPNLDYAHVKVWDDKGIQKLQFYLFKEEQVIKILVYPATANSMGQFDNIVSSIRL